MTPFQRGEWMAEILNADTFAVHRIGDSHFFISRIGPTIPNYVIVDNNISFVDMLNLIYLVNDIWTYFKNNQP